MEQARLGMEESFTLILIGIFLGWLLRWWTHTKPRAVTVYEDPDDWWKHGKEPPEWRP
jgi:hypothetical protein